MREGESAAIAEASRHSKQHGQLTFCEQGRRGEEGEVEVHVINEVEMQVKKSSKGVLGREYPNTLPGWHLANCPRKCKIQGSIILCNFT